MAMAHQLPWTEAEDATLLRMHRANASFADIAVELGRTAGACSARVTTLRQAGRSIERRVTGVRYERPALSAPAEAEDKREPVDTKLACAGHLLDLLRSGRRHWATLAGARA